MHYELDAVKIEKELNHIFNRMPPKTLTAKGAEIQALRLKGVGREPLRKWSQEELGIHTGVPQARISRLERGDIKSTDPGALFVIALAFDVPLSQIAVGVPDVSKKLSGKVNQQSISSSAELPTNNNLLISEERREQILSAIQPLLMIKTILSPGEARPLEDVYYPIRLIAPDGKTFTAQSIQDFSHESLVIIEGYVGQGKSVLLRYLAQTSLETQNLIPIFCEPSKLGELKLIEYIQQVISSYGMPHSTEDIEYLLENNHVVLLLDAFDEFPKEDRSRIVSELFALKSKYATLPIVISTRPNTEIHLENSVTIYRINELTRNDFVPLATKLCPDRDEEELSRLLRGDRIDLSSLLTSPLMVAALLLRFQPNQFFPKNAHLFYRDLFDLLIRRHNSSEFGLKHQLSSDLDFIGLQRFFEALCYSRFLQYGTTDSHISSFRKSALRAAQVIGFQGKPLDALQDIIEITNLITETSGTCQFQHPSICDFHAASFVADQPTQPVCEFYGSARIKWNVCQNLLTFLSIIDEARFIAYLEIPDLEEITSYNEISYLEQFHSLRLTGKEGGKAFIEIRQSKTYSIRYHQITMGDISVKKLETAFSKWCPRVPFPEIEAGKSIAISMQSIDVHLLAAWLGNSLAAGLSSCHDRLNKNRKKLAAMLKQI